VPEAVSASAESSRDSTSGAGWACTPGSYRQLMDDGPLRPGRRRSFAWLDPAPLWASRNDRIARMLGDPTAKLRQQWLEQLPADNPDRIVEVAGAPDGSISFLLMGDTGEGDASQFAVVPPLETQAPGSAFLFICSDVIYPAGGIDEYLYNFFKPYRRYDGPIYAIPGNHDWYDDCTGFMYWFCGVAAAPRKPGGLLRSLLWRRPPAGHPDLIKQCRELRPAPEQPGPYLVIDAGPLRLVGIDTGITNSIDADQGRWLHRVSQGPRPKILLTGKPLYVDGERRPGRIEKGGALDEIITAPEHNYIAAIGGDIHNYQRYPVQLPDGRTMPYLVSGGGGAFMHETHTIPNMDETQLGVSEKDFRCYPLRGDSLSRYSQLYASKLLGRIAGAGFIPPDQASALMGEQLGIVPTRPSARRIQIEPRARRTAERLRRLPKRGRKGLHIPFSEWLDSDEPPFFKNFLRIDADAESVRIRCFGVTGCSDQEHSPPVEDELLAKRQDDGTWAWTLSKE
jgi:hypothetical protein